ncbi:MAG: hypothetical protein QNJ42_09775 [Crocosphaera sp.]|nr:hypothetical protein [Crocosphaera sp.]
MEELDQLIQQAIAAQDNNPTYHYQQLFTRITSIMQQSGQIREHYRCFLAYRNHLRCCLCAD